MIHAIYYTSGGHCAVFTCGEYVIKIGRIPAHNVAFLRSLPRYQPEIMLYVRDRYIPAFGIVADILVMRKYTPAMVASRETMAHWIAGSIKGELAQIHPYVWGDSTGYNLAFDARHKPVIIDA